MPKHRPENVTGAVHGKSANAPGQGELHVVVNRETGETMEVSQATWRTMDKEVWTRPEETTGGETPASDSEDVPNATPEA